MIELLEQHGVVTELGRADRSLLMNQKNQGADTALSSEFGGRYEEVGGGGEGAGGVNRLRIGKI